MLITRFGSQNESSLTNQIFSNQSTSQSIDQMNHFRKPILGSMLLCDDIAASGGWTHITLIITTKSSSRGGECNGLPSLHRQYNLHYTCWWLLITSSAYQTCASTTSVISTLPTHGSYCLTSASLSHMHWVGNHWHSSVSVMHAMNGFPEILGVVRLAAFQVCIIGYNRWLSEDCQVRM